MSQFKIKFRKSFKHEWESVTVSGYKDLEDKVSELGIYKRLQIVKMCKNV